MARRSWVTSEALAVVWTLAIAPISGIVSPAAAASDDCLEFDKGRLPGLMVGSPREDIGAVQDAERSPRSTASPRDNLRVG